MISSKKITLISICLVSMAIVLLLLTSVLSGTDNPLTGEIAYSDEHKITYAEDDFYNEGYLSFPVKINLKGDYATSNSRNVSIDGSTVTIMGGGTYVVSGALTDGSIVVDSQDSASVNIVLNSAHITSSSSPAIAVKQSKKTTISTAEGTQNILSDGTSYSSDTDGNAALYSKDDLTLNGKGSLTVNGNCSDGIKCNDTLKITEGTLTVSATDDGINVNDVLGIPGGNITITAGGDAIKCENSDDRTKGFIALDSAKLELSCQKDGITASSNVYITDILCNITQCREGIEGAYITIDSGDISIVSSDDGINAVGTNPGGFARPMPGMDKETITNEDVYLTINGGTLKINTGGDGIDSNGAAIVNGGNIVVFGPENSGNSSLDFEYGFVINGGTLIAAGSSGMAEAPHNKSKNRSLIFILDQKYTGDITVTDYAGKVLFEANSPKSFDWICVSSADIIQGEEYKLNINSAETAAVTCDNTVTSYGERRFGR